MNGNQVTPKRILASALLSTGLLGGASLIGEETLPSQEQIEPQLCENKFQCSKTGFIVHFLPNSKALFIHPASAQKLKADYTVRFNRDVSINVYVNPSKHFDLTMHNIMIYDEGFYAKVNRENRYFQKV